MMGPKITKQKMTIDVYTWLCPGCNQQLQTNYEPPDEDYLYCDLCRNRLADERKERMIADFKAQHTWLIGAKIVDLHPQDDNWWEWEELRDVLEITIETIEGKRFRVYPGDDGYFLAVIEARESKEH